MARAKKPATTSLASDPVHVLFASAEAAPVARVGGLAEASAGLIRSLRTRDDVRLDVVLPDYGDVVLDDESTSTLPGVSWTGPLTVRTGQADQLGRVSLIGWEAMHRPHPYVDETGLGWEDNADRFFGFSAGVAQLAEALDPHVVHCNDWHTAMTLAWSERPSVYTIHTLGYQGQADIGWLREITTDRASAFDRWGELNPAAGAIRLADRVIAVSPNYAQEILDPARSAGLHGVLSGRGEDLVGIRNGIDVSLWNPADDPHLHVGYGPTSLADKAEAKHELCAELGWEDVESPVIGVVTRLVEQKGLDLLLGLIPYLDRAGARIALLGSGEERLSLWARDLSTRSPEQLAFVEGYDVALAHRIFAGADLFAMPSRFEPCGLAQMQSMAYGTIPVVTPVGGLVDTVIDADADPDAGNGFVAVTVDGVGMLDAIHRALRAWHDTRRRARLQKRGMKTDWSWDQPTEQHVEIYRSVRSDSAVE